MSLHKVLLRPLAVASLGFLALLPVQAQFIQEGGKLTGTGTVGSAELGQSVALSADGNTAIVGGPFDNSHVGAAWVFTRTNGVWSQEGSKLVGTGAVGNANQGGSVALSADGNTAIVGGSGDDSLVGASWVFTRTNGVWSQQGSKLVGTGAVGTAGQGQSVALSADGNTAIVGGPGDRYPIGATWVFTRTNGVWSQQGSKLVGTGIGFSGMSSQGSSLALSADGNTAIVGGPFDNFAINNAGAVWVFTRTNGAWSQQGNKLVGTGHDGMYVFQGASVDVSGDGNIAIVGGYADHSGAGASWIFTRTNGVWSQQGSKLVGTGAVSSAYQGQSVTLSADGNTAMVGGPGDNPAGAAWVFTSGSGSLTITLYDAENWGQPGVDARAMLYNSGDSLIAQASANASSTVTFSGIQVGTEYYYRVYDNRTTAWGEQFWGEKTGITINANPTTIDTFTHNTPYMPSVGVYIDSTNELLPDSTKRLVPPGTRLRIELQIKNPAYVGAQTVSGYGALYLDRDKAAPYDIHLTTSPQSYPTGTTKTAVFHCDAPAMPGSYYLSVGTFASSSRYASTLTDASGWHDPAFTVESSTQLVYPPYRALDVPTNIALRWRSSEGATHYHLQLGTDSLLESGLVINDSTQIDTNRAVGPLLYNVDYFWRVKALMAGGTGGFSPIWSFRTVQALPSRVQLVYPTAGLTVTTSVVAFVWNRSFPEVTRYGFELAADSLFAFRTVDSTIVDTTHIYTGLANQDSYWWRVRGYNSAGWGSYSDPRKFTISVTGVDEDGATPKTFQLSQNYPNPFNPNSDIRYQISEFRMVRLSVYDLLGREVAVLVNECKMPGYYTVNFEANGLASGVYFYRLHAGDFVQAKKLVLLR